MISFAISKLNLLNEKRYTTRHPQKENMG